MRRQLLAAVAAASLMALVATSAALATAGSLPSQLIALRAAVARYHDYNQALLAGYTLAGEPCVSTAAGTMGYHAVNFAIAVTGVNDPARPPILLYAPKNGKLQLVAVEYFHVA